MSEYTPTTKRYRVNTKFSPPLLRTNSRTFARITAKLYSIVWSEPTAVVDNYFWRTDAEYEVVFMHGTKTYDY